jgi:serine acetyltransferase
LRRRAFSLAQRIIEVFAMNIHLAVALGKGILLYHATSIVIGETAIIGDNVSIHSPSQSARTRDLRGMNTWRLHM